MSTEQVSTKAKETWKAVKEMLEKAEENVHKEVAKASPVVQRSLDSSMATAGKAFRSTVKTIDTGTQKERLELFKAYRKFLSGQVEYVDSRVKDLETRQKEKPSEPAPKPS